MAYSHAVDMRHEIYVQTTEEFLFSRGMELLAVLRAKLEPMEVKTRQISTQQRGVVQ